jgi:PhnB protein
MKESNMTVSVQQQTETQPMPKTQGGLVAYLQVDGALKAAEFYKRAFAAEQVFNYPPDEQGRTMHVHLYVNGSSLMLGDAYPDYGHPLEKAQGYTMQLILDDDIDAWWDRAVEAGCEVVTPLQVMFWGDRWGQLRDPFGVAWAMNAPVKHGLTAPMPSRQGA